MGKEKRGGGRASPVRPQCRPRWPRRRCGRRIRTRWISRPSCSRCSGGRGVAESPGPVRRSSQARCRSCASVDHHTAHQASTARIHYRHHPFFPQDVTVLRRWRRAAGEQVMVRVASGTRFAIPCWMLDQAHCSLLTDEAKPRIAAQALVSLRTMLDHQPLLNGPHRSSSRASKGGRDAPKKQAHSTAPDGAHHASASRLATTARATAKPQPPTPDPDAVGRAAKRNGRR